ncbi:hypothetical protein BZA70DRAFT_275982 [Myxozyma melibiosi]|uniref:RING-type domain-containing protein n=1 Tax=Myxozyma melibiosi TaxID=54550 RepID=A0ABR1F8V1_9ASCO
MPRSRRNRAYCGHLTECMLANRRQCCACQDRRPHSEDGRYMIYIDGRGNVNEGMRWSLYCTACKDYWNQLHEQELSEIRAREEEALQAERERSESEEQAAAPVQPSRHFPVFIRPKTCAHHQSQCALTTTDLCCHCMDRRPVSENGRYDIYVDGRGTVNEGRRWAMYCNPCKEYWERLTAEEDGERAVPAVEQSRARTQRVQRMRNALGTAEEISSDDYVSPVTSMFQRAIRWRLQQQRFERRQEPRWRANEDGAGVGAIAGAEGGDDDDEPEVMDIQPVDEETERRRQEEARQIALEREERLRQLQGDEQERVNAVRERRVYEIVQSRQAQETSDYALAMMLQEQEDREEAGEARVGVVEEAVVEEHAEAVAAVEKREAPPPLEPEELVVNVECKICFAQVANIVFLPCAHLAVCEYCAESHAPEGRNGALARMGRLCPICRQAIKRKLKVYRV